MAAQLIEARSELQRAAEQLKDEAEARMRAESRATEAAGDRASP
jgi:hypothetical protein